jgi:hypothetical protein
MFRNITKPGEKEKTNRCPCCKFKTLHGRAGYEICEICFWEDDGQDEHDAEEVRGGPNGTLSLRQAQINFSEFGAVEQRLLKHVRKPLQDEF